MALFASRYMTNISDKDVNIEIASKEQPHEDKINMAKSLLMKRFLYVISILMVILGSVFLLLWLNGRYDLFEGEQQLSRTVRQTTTNIERDDWDEDCSTKHGYERTGCESRKYDSYCPTQLTRIDVNESCYEHTGEKNWYIPRFVYVHKCSGKCSWCPKGKTCRPTAKGTETVKKIVWIVENRHTVKMEIETDGHHQCSCQDESKEVSKPKFECSKTSD